MNNNMHMHNTNFINLKKRALGLAILKCQHERKRISIDLMDLLLSKEATNFIAKGVALASALQIELTENNRREINRCYHIAIFRTISITWVPQNIEI